MSSKIRLEGGEVIPAQAEGNSDVFHDQPFLLAKSRWVSDDEAVICLVCQNKFNQLRRKHHCRQCGRVLCSKCCKEKVPLPQLGFEEPERVCDYCLPITELVTKSRSRKASFQQEAAITLSEEIRSPSGLCKVVELGGVQTLIFLSRLSDEKVRLACARSLHLLATHQPLHKMLADSGAIKAVCSLLSSANENQEQLIIDGISTLMIFCKAPYLKAKAITNGALQPVLSLCSMNVSEAIALLAVMTLNLITEHQGNHAALIENDRNALPRLLSLTTAKDEQMQEVALKTLARLSMGSDWHRHRIIQEDFSSGRCLVTAIRNRPRNKQVLSNAACLIANLATSEQDQGTMVECMDGLCTLLMQTGEQKDLLAHVARGIANFSKFKQNSYKLVQHLPNIISICVKSPIENVSQHGLRTVLFLLQYSTDATISFLMNDGAVQVFNSMVKTLGVMDNMQRALVSNVQERVSPS
ncbi:zinc finger FYVE domain-containing protein 26-like [Anneissia japonica]|uniref:zinc finger FYVE domain-containing protein 26-like n=1 Tax=Anneissia japonica TaxID=1529436 RepID=UPI0014255CFF|nr:zinc finger FYVE domain-containing protein 26-like [Anneissia japonica]